MRENVACAYESSCGVYPFILLFSKNDLCFKVNILVSEEGALHNRQIWPEALRVAILSVLSPQITLMWNNLAFCLWCFPPFSLCCTLHLLSFILSWNDLKIYCICLTVLCYTVYFFCFKSAARCLVLCTRGFLSYIVCFYSLCSHAVFWIPNCSACSLEGEWWLTFIICWVHYYIIVI